MVSKNELQVFKNYITWLFYGDRNNAVVECYNDYRRGNTPSENLEQFELLPNNENTLKTILNDNEYLECMYGYCEEEINQWLKEVK